VYTRSTDDSTRC